MEAFTELAIVLKSFAYQERDRIAVCLTENHGRITGLAKGGTNSRRYGGSLGFLACSKIAFTQKAGAELARIDEAASHYEFTHLHLDFNRLTAASFAAEICLRLLEPHAPSREVFSVLSNFLYFLDEGLSIPVAVNAFLNKTLSALGYTPTLFRCVQCQRPAHELLASHSRLFWNSEGGGLLCESCGHGVGRTGSRVELDSQKLLCFHRLGTVPFRQLCDETAFHAELENPVLYRVLTDFLHHHLPGVPALGFKSSKLMNEVIYGTSAQPGFLSLV